MVGDKGMIKSRQIDDIKASDWHYITSITKKQIEALTKAGTIQLELFEEKIIEVQDNDVRYVLRRNPMRAEQIQINREEKIKKIKNLVEKENQYLANHPRAKSIKAIERIRKKIEKLKLKSILSIKSNYRNITIQKNEQVLNQQKFLDGCYAIKTDLSKKHASAKTIHDRYKDLAKVEHAFRTFKTGLEEIRPIFVRKGSRTRGHVFVCMLAYKLIHKLRCSLTDIEEFPTIKEIIKSMEAIHYCQYVFQGKTIKIAPTKFNSIQNKIIKALNISPIKMYAK